ncbi:MAG TPA: sugar phosphate isomerase/epimerase family protein [Tepidisphaeraceae bacterium]|jgi:sugar phosphate isomerase/epimerase|nr:sugar phosphate isomerase/epimerase family protein [Tepidisphaeraceae bacterium]
MKLCGFADEIAPELDEQIKCCKENDVTHFELRGVYGKNVLDFDKSVRIEVKSKLKANGMGVASIGSPIGKVKITEPWEKHFERFKIAVDSAEFFEAPFIRIFSYYPGDDGKDIRTHRDEVVRRMRAKVDYIKNRNVALIHENEKGIYGASGKDCLDLLKTVDSPKFRAAFDFGNFVQVKQNPLEAWPALKPYTVHIHIKDVSAKDDRAVPAGHGDGHVEEILVDLKKSGYSGFLSLEPHLKAAEQFSGFSGPALFKMAVDALKALCKKNGIQLAGF